MLHSSIRKPADSETWTEKAVHHVVRIADEDEEVASLAQPEEYILLAYQDTPRFLRTPFILSGYRSYFPFRFILLSLFRLHNESVNVWSHLAGLCYFVYRAVHTLSGRHPDFSWMDFASLLVFYFTASLCMLLSSLFHLAGCHSAQLHVTLYRLDLIGICCLVLGSYFAGLYLGFYCHTHIQIRYLGAVSLLLIVTLIFITSERFGTQKYHPYRVTLLVSVVAFSLIPIVHWASIVTHQQLSESLWGVLSMLLLYLAGFGFYWTQLPEKCRPGTFDLWCSSHQLWHLFVFLAAAVWEQTLWGYARLTVAVPCPI